MTKLDEVILRGTTVGKPAAGMAGRLYYDTDLEQLERDNGSTWDVCEPAAGASDAADVTYTPTTATDWDGDADPGDVDGALDQLAERVDDLETAPPAHAHDAADVTYTPTVATDWDSDADPGDVDNALDQLAERVDDLEAAGGGSVATDAIWDAAGDLAVGSGANTAARLAIGTAGQLLRVNSGATAPEWASVGRVLIGEATPDGVDTVTWSSIPATYKKLVIEYVARSTKAAANDEGMSCYLNNDTTAANYRRGLMNGYTTTDAYSQADDAIAAYLPAASAVAGSCASGKIEIIQYAGTTFKKQIIARNAYRFDASTLQEVTQHCSIEWESTSAVDRIDLYLGTGDFVAGSTFRLYGEF